MNITVVGSVGLDTITTPLGKVEDALGGSAGHFAVTASNFAPVHLVAVVGEDFPKEHLELFKARGIDVRGLQIVPGRTFRWTGYYSTDFHTRETLETQLNVFEGFDPVLPEDCRQTPLVFLANIHPRLQLKVLEQVDRPRLVLGDTMNFWIESDREGLLEVIKKLDVFLLSDSEVEELCETHDLMKAARQLLEMGPDRVIIKKGPHGALMVSQTDVFSVPAFSDVKVVDPTGAGDSFAGGFFGSIARYQDFTDLGFRRAVAFGCVMGAFNVEGFSLDRTRDLEMTEIFQRYENLRQLTVY